MGRVSHVCTCAGHPGERGEPVPISNEIEKRIRDAADANSKLKASEYSVPAPGLIFLRHADHRFQVTDEAIQAERAGQEGGRCQRLIGWMTPSRMRCYWDIGRGPAWVSTRNVPSRMLAMWCWLCSWQEGIPAAGPEPQTTGCLPYRSMI